MSNMSFHSFSRNNVSETALALFMDDLALTSLLL